MLVYLSLSLSLVSFLGIVVLYFRFRRRENMTIDDLSTKISSLLSEFNSVTSSKIDLLDDRSEDVNNLVRRAERDIEELRSLIKKAEETRKILNRVTKESDDNDQEFVRDEVLELAEQGYTTSQIADETGLKPGEVSVIVRLNRSEFLGN